MSIPLVSDTLLRRRENIPVKNWQLWGRRFRAHCQEKDISLAQVAERIGKAEPTVRSWTNGTRMAGLDDFFALCHAVDADPSFVLFGIVSLTQDQSEALGKVVKAVLEADPAAHPHYGRVISGIKKKPKHG